MSDRVAIITGRFRQIDATVKLPEPPAPVPSPMEPYDPELLLNAMFQLSLKTLSLVMLIAEGTVIVDGRAKVDASLREAIALADRVLALKRS